METLQASLGQFYFQAHNNTPPTFLQVTGWTKGAEREETKRLYVYVRKVPLRVHNYMGNGEWLFDEEIIQKYATEITSPIHDNKNKLVDGNAIIIPGGDFLRYQGVTVPKKSS